MLDRKFFALGNLAIDDLVYVDGTTRWCVPGGGALYAALGMALWTQSAELVAVLGPDYPRTAFAARVSSSGVEASLRACAIGAYMTTTERVIFSPAAARQIGRPTRRFPAIYGPNRTLTVT